MAQNNNAAKIRQWTPRLLVLGVIWGIAVFLWGTFGEWTRDQYIESERRVTLTQASRIDAWLQAAIEPLGQLANDKRLEAGMELPAGVESLPVQRVLYEYSYLTGQSEVYIVDLVHRRIGHTAGATPLADAVIDRLTEMGDDGQMIMGVGERGAQMLLVKKVPAAMPNRLVVLVPVSLPTLATGQPTYNLPAERELNLIVAHGSDWAQWRDGEPEFVMDDDLNHAMAGGAQSYVKDAFMNVLVPLPGWPDVMLELQSPNTISGARILPQMLVLAWALMMSAMVMWGPTYLFRKKILNAAGPAFGPLARSVVPMQMMVHKLADAIAVSFKSAAAKDIPLSSGPGQFDETDFESPAARARLRLGLKRNLKNEGKLSLSHGGPMAAHKTATDRPARAIPEKVSMQWPEKRDLTENSREELLKNIEDSPDEDDVEGIVVDCLRKRRVKLLYQPIFRAGDNMPLMHEVYARLVKANGTIITPDVFLPIAAQNKLTLELDLMVLRKVVAEHFQGNHAPITPLALNISSTSLDGIAYLHEMAGQSPRVLQKLSFEVSSQEMIRDPKALRLLKDMQKHGGNLAVDYFGGGTAMLEASKAMGFNYVKLNAMRLLGTDAGKKEIINLCQHARGLNLPIILEMVSDDAAVEFGRRAGAEFLQGYAMAKPGEQLHSQPLPMPMNLAAAGN